MSILFGNIYHYLSATPIS